MVRTLKIIGGVLLTIFIGTAILLFVAPPDLLRVGTNYAAKIVCSSVFVSGRDAEEALAVDVQAPGHPVLGFINVEVDEDTQTVRTQLLSIFAPAVSQHRAGLGCTNTHETTLSDASIAPMDPLDNALWPDGNQVAASLDPNVADVLRDEALVGPGYRAVVVVKDGRIVGQTYADGFDAAMPLLGWSMTKTVTAAIIGSLIQSQDMALDDTMTDVFPAWTADDRARITLSDMLGMANGLAWNEGYGSVSDVTEMLYLSDDMAGFAASKAAEAAPQTVFNYSSGTSTALSRVWQAKLGDAALDYPNQALFAPLGMTSAVMETDSTDTFVGSSYMYATARDWARFGQFLLQDGIWEGQRILPEGFTDWMFGPVSASGGAYARGHLWRQAPGRDSAFEDAVWLQGHDGQSVGIFPSRNMVVVRLGLTPSRLGYSPVPLAEALIAALE
ncbi:MAG: serine hydrolase [Pseudomonadota bacterium]